MSMIWASWSWLSWTYWLMCLGLLAVIVSEIFKEKGFWKQVSAAMIIIPLILRALMLK